MKYKIKHISEAKNVAQYMERRGHKYIVQAMEPDCTQYLASFATKEDAEKYGDKLAAKTTN